MRYVAIDPGNMCGVATTTQDPRFNAWDLFMCELDPFQTVSMLDHDANIDTVFIERYTTTSLKMTVQPAALEVIGAVRYICRRNNTRLIVQPRSDKRIVTDDTLRGLAWWKPTRDGHANDAARHLIVGLMRSRPDHPAVRRAYDMIAA